MTKKVSEINWNQIMQKFSSYEGIIADFCRENKISQHQLYYRRKMLKKKSNPIFHGIQLNKEESTHHTNNRPQDSGMKEIKIEIGKANIYIPTSEITLLSNIIQELTKSC